jgi:hypothetical protein
LGGRIFRPLKVQRPGDKPGIAQLYGWIANYDDWQRRDPDDTYYHPNPCLKALFSNVLQIC